MDNLVVGTKVISIHTNNYQGKREEQYMSIYCLLFTVFYKEQNSIDIKSHLDKYFQKMKLIVYHIDPKLLILIHHRQIMSIGFFNDDIGSMVLLG